MRVAASIVGLLGLALAAYAYSSWREASTFTVPAEGVVSQRTQTFCAIRVEGEVPGGRASVELPYSAVSGAGSDVPPAAGPEFALGDKVALLHPPGRPASARLKEGFAPSVPPWAGWAGAVIFAIAAIAFLLARPAANASGGAAGHGAPASAPPYPYGIDRRPMPTAEDPEVLLPSRVGPFSREPLRRGPGEAQAPVYASYRDGASMVFVELGICGSTLAARMALDTARGELAADAAKEGREAPAVRRGEPSFLRARSEQGAFMGWTRGGYYFSAHAPGGEADLDRFMQSFPF